MIYRSDLRQEINDRLMSVHTSGEIGDLQSTDSLIEENVVLRCKAIRGMNH